MSRVMLESIEVLYTLVDNIRRVYETSKKPIRF